MAVEWYYVENAQQLGPVSPDELKALASAGKIDGATLVWHDGLNSWLPLGEIEPNIAPPVPSVHYQCGECGKIFPEDKIIPFGKFVICSGCKPRFFLRLKQGTRLPGVMDFAGFWPRFWAKFLDGLIVGVVYFAFAALGTITLSSAKPDNPAMFLGLTVMLMVFQFGISILYTIYFIGKYSATPGKMAMGLIVVTADGDKPTYGLATKRFLAEILSAMTMYIGYLMVLFDEEKRSLHDRICDTRVVVK